MRQVFVLSIRFLVTRRLLGLVAHLTVCDGVSVCASAIVQDIRCFGYATYDGSIQGERNQNG